MTFQKEDIPRKLTNFEEALTNYKNVIEDIDKKHIELLVRDEESKIFYKQIKQIVGILYQRGAELAVLMEVCINKQIIAEFRYKLKSMYNLSDNYMHDAFDREQDIKSLEKIYWDVKPIIIREYEFQKEKLVKLNLKDNVDTDAKEYLKEAERSLNANAPRASVVIAGAALEKILRKIHNVKIGKSEGIKLWKIMENLENKNIFKNEKEEIILKLCKFFRNFSAHPSQLVVSNDLARIIFQSVESLINSEAKQRIPKNSDG